MQLYDNILLKSCQNEKYCKKYIEKITTHIFCLTNFLKKPCSLGGNA